MEMPARYTISSSSRGARSVPRSRRQRCANQLIAAIVKVATA